MRKSYYIGLTGAKKNIGDFLITQRCIELLTKFKPDYDIKIFNHWETLENNLDIVNNSKAIIIFGGPGYQYNMYPNIYKLLHNLDNISVPIIPLGLGWKGVPGDYQTLSHYNFSYLSKKLLNKMSKEHRALSCRDYYTHSVLNRNGIQNVIMTGCPVWYDLKSIGTKITIPKKFNKIVFTPAQNKIFRNQSIAIIKLLKRIFPDAQLYCSFHRGINTTDNFTTRSDIKNNHIIMHTAEKIGYSIVDAAYNLKNIAFYDECELHVGYRVHGHLYFLSKRKPSFLIHEDGRGRGVSESLNLFGIDAFRRTCTSLFFEIPALSVISRQIDRFINKIKPNQYAVSQLEDTILQELENNFCRFHGLHNVIDSHFKIMKEFIKNLP
ncbi:MAG: polysaccharide pyruvyl transferase family protein [Spirochaetales bacterium]|nr:polysaccharide pyruvyl transferase family protein [Spirochaetales bacterium]